MCCFAPLDSQGTSLELSEIRITLSCVVIDLGVCRDGPVLKSKAWMSQLTS
jgi:hypothetical protein